MVLFLFWSAFLSCYKSNWVTTQMRVITLEPLTQLIIIFYFPILQPDNNYHSPWITYFTREITYINFNIISFKISININNNSIYYVYYINYIL